MEFRVTFELRVTSDQLIDVKVHKLYRVTIMCISPALL